MMMGSNTRQEPDPLFVRRIAAEIGARYRRYQDDPEGIPQGEFRAMLDELEQAERASAERRA